MVVFFISYPNSWIPNMVSIAFWIIFRPKTHETLLETNGFFAPENGFRWHSGFRGFSGALAVRFGEGMKLYPRTTLHTQILRPQAALSRQRDTEADARHELAAGSSGIGPHCSTPTKYWVGFPTRFNRYYPWTLQLLENKPVVKQGFCNISRRINSKTRVFWLKTRFPSCHVQQMRIEITRSRFVCRFSGTLSTWNVKNEVTKITINITNSMEIGIFLL